ncbi:hypothetical protein BWP39_15660 [Paraburkholderia acidicola]|uniref:DUF4148 domain-containing protein n=1 Tax=Paraburkholderia acidicola TaxID=1912599 RepID=A0A2A4F069_9BURK|nr:DUF4148 domain-containing protein [Paraburkholderia acidicola]PCE25964.1 hypothetical protein BWP39_15660 [Paraburkholderia acidicola]
MNTRLFTLTVAAAIALPVAAYAQDSSSTVTRAQVRAELVQLESVGYRPSRVSPNYPTDIQAAEAAVAAQNGTGSNVGSSVGGVHSGSSASGNRVNSVVANASIGSFYAHH